MNAMPTSIVLPSLGMYTAEGKVVRWLHDDGARVEAGAPILEVETEKAISEIIAPASGTLRQMATPGTLVKEEGLLGYIFAEGETVAVENAAPPARAKASPIARKLATEHGIDLATVTGTGPGGRIVEADVLQRVQARDAAAPPASSLRRAIAERLRKGLEGAIPLTLTREVEAGALVRARASLSSRLNAPVPWDAFFVKLLAIALRKDPALNQQPGAAEGVDICVAIAVPDGLVAPVIRGAHAAGVGAIGARIRELAGRARAGTLRAEDLRGGVSTVTNLGAQGVDAFTPVLNPPQTSILGIGRIRPRPVVRDGAPSVAETCWLSLTFDHRATDGAPAAGILDDLARMMADDPFLSSLAET